MAMALMLTSIYPIPSAEPRAELGTCRSLIQLLQEKKDPPPPNAASVLQEQKWSSKRLGSYEGYAELC